MEISPLSRGAAVEGVGERPTAPADPHLPLGRETNSVQPYPIPFVTPVALDGGAADAEAKRQHVAQLRADIDGTGSLVNAIA